MIEKFKEMANWQ